MNATDWLNAWERSLELPPALRPCALLAPLLEEGQAGAERLSIGQRDACLFDLYQALFGPELTATACCPACGERQEFSLSVIDLRRPEPLSAPASELNSGDCQVRFRLPDSRDLAAIARCENAQAAHGLLLQRCVLAASVGKAECDPTQLPEELLAELATAMTAADPQAVTELAMTCPVCGHGWDDSFDIAAYLLEVLGQWAERELDQVHLLAGAYGWSEREILGLTSSRRARYIARILS